MGNIYKNELSFNFNEEYDTTQLICTVKMFAVAVGSFDRQIYQFFCLSDNSIYENYTTIKKIYILPKKSVNQNFC